MPISFNCPQCSKAYRVADDKAGIQARCECGTLFQVPQTVAPVQQQPVAPVQQQPVAPVQQQPMAPVQQQPAVANQPFDPLAGPPPAPAANLTPQMPAGETPQQAGAASQLMSSWAEPDRGKRSLVDKLGKKRLITIGAGGAALLLGLVTFIMIKYVGFDTSEMVISDGSSAAPSDPHGAFDYWTKVFRTGSSDDKHLAQCEIVERVAEIYSRVKFPQFGPGDEEDQAVRGLDYGMDRIAENEYELKLYNNLLNDFGDETVGKYQQRYRKAVAQLVSELDRIDRLSSSLRGKIAVSRMFGS